MNNKSKLPDFKFGNLSLPHTNWCGHSPVFKIEHNDFIVRIIDFNDSDKYVELFIQNAFGKEFFIRPVDKCLEKAVEFFVKCDEKVDTYTKLRKEFFNL